MTTALEAVLFEWDRFSEESDRPAIHESVTLFIEPLPITLKQIEHAKKEGCSKWLDQLMHYLNAAGMNAEFKEAILKNVHKTPAQFSDAIKFVEASQAVPLENEMLEDQKQMMDGSVIMSVDWTAYVTEIATKQRAERQCVPTYFPATSTSTYRDFENAVALDPYLDDKIYGFCQLRRDCRLRYFKHFDAFLQHQGLLPTDIATVIIKFLTQEDGVTVDNIEQAIQDQTMNDNLISTVVFPTSTGRPVTIPEKYVEALNAIVQKFVAPEELLDDIRDKRWAGVIGQVSEEGRIVGGMYGVLCNCLSLAYARSSSN